MFGADDAALAAEAGGKNAGGKAATNAAAEGSAGAWTPAVSMPVTPPPVPVESMPGVFTMTQPAVDNGLFLGLSPTQWGQQALFQGGGALLKGMGASNVNDARQSAYNRFDSHGNQVQADIDTAINNALTPWENGGVQSGIDSRKAAMIDKWNQTRPSFGQTPLLDSTPDVVRSDQGARAATQKAASDKSFAGLADLNSFADLLGTNGITTAEQLAKARAARAVGKTSTEQLGRDLQFANHAGDALSGAGDIASSTGNLLLASQLSKKVK